MGIHIGRIIKQTLDESKISITDFAKKINKERSNVYDIFKRESIDTDLLIKISRALDHNFFSYYEDVEKVSNEENVLDESNISNFDKKTPKFYILIEVEDESHEKQIMKMLNMK